MAMTNGSGSGATSSDINVTPLIDILLVLLIIFMVIVPVAPKGLSALAPQSNKSEPTPNPDIVVVSVLHENNAQEAYKINQVSVAKSDLLSKLTAIYANRAERIMFVKGDNEVEFSQIAEVIDLGHSAGADQIGLITPRGEAGQ